MWPALLAYDALLLALLPAAAPVALALLLRRRWRQGLASRLGLGWPCPCAGEVLWGHAASVGEVEGIAPLVRRWHERHPRGAVVVSTSTETGRETASRLLPWAEVQLLPLDLPFLVARVVRRVRPSLFVFSENELWPNLLWALRRRGTPVVQVSGRISPRAAATLARLPLLGRAVLEQVSLFCVQAEEHRKRLLALGVAPGRVIVTGSLKAAARAAPHPPAFLASAIATGRPLVVAGSTHAGEEEAVLDAARSLAGRRPPPLWVLAPRHPERFDVVADLLERRGVAALRRSRLPAEPQAAQEALSRCEVLLLDTLGELAGCYCGAAVAFVGGTLVPVGGHNLLEPARASVPVVVGSNLEAVSALAAELEREGGAAIVRDRRELAEAVARFLDATGDSAGRAARAVAERHAGTLAATWEALETVRCGPGGGA